MPRSSLLPLALLACAATVNCSKAHQQGHGSIGIQSVCGLVADGAHELVYVGDLPGGRLVSISTETGDEESRIDLGSSIGGLAADHCLKLLNVSVTARHRIDTIDLERFVRVSSLKMGTSCYALLTLKNDHLVVVTGIGLIDIDPVTLARRTLATTVDSKAVLVADSDSHVLFVVETTSGNLVVSRYDLLQPTLPPVTTQPGSLLGRHIGAALDFFESKLYVASDSADGVYVLDATTLATAGTIPIGPGLSAMSLNPTTTRMYVSHGDFVVDSLNLSNFNAGRRTFATSPVAERGLQIGANGLTLVTHETSAAVEDFFLFDARLNGVSTVREGSHWTLTLDGPPDALFYLFAAADPGYTFIDPPTDVDPRFLDQELGAGFRALFAGTLDAAGHFEISGVVPAPGQEIKVVLQAVVLPQPGRAFLIVSNPLLGHLLPPECD